MDFEIRELQFDDARNGLIDTLSSLANVGLTEEEASKIVYSRLSYQWRNLRSWVAVSKERVIGHISLILERKLIHNGGLVGQIEDVAVHRDFQKLGIGKALIEHAINYCKTQRTRKVILNCSPGLQSYYALFGFKHHNLGMRLDMGNE